MDGSVHKLVRPRDGRVLGGVCAGFARQFGLDVTLVRVLWVPTAFLGGLGFIAYLVFWLILPPE